LFCDRDVGTFLEGIRLKKNANNLLCLCVCICALASPLFAGSADGYPSLAYQEGKSIVWKVGDVPVWRFPLAAKAEVAEMSHRFNRLYGGGFGLKDLHVIERNGTWSLCVKDQVLFTAAPRHAVDPKLSPEKISLMWLSRIYEAVGAMHAEALTPKHKLRGGYDIETSVSWYGDKLVGRNFANGECFTKTHLTAAAKNLPFGTLVRVTTPATGRSVVLRVTDRFPEHKGRALDISQAAAEVLGIKGMGVAKARVQVIGSVNRIGGK